MNINEKQLHRMLRGKVVNLWCFGVLAVLLGVGAPFALAPYGTDNPERKSAIIICALFILMLVGLAVYEGKRSRAASATMRHLKATGMMDAALAELNGENILVLRHPQRLEEKSAGNVLTQQFVFIFTAGRVLRYYQISGLSIEAEKDKLLLCITDSKGKKLTLVECPLDQQDTIRQAVEYIRKCYPGCPEVTDGTSPKTV